MKLKYDKKISGGKVFITLNIYVSSTEFKAIRMIGEDNAIISFSKTYTVSKNNVIINVPLLKLKNYEVVFRADNVNNIYMVAQEALMFVEDFKDYIEELVEDFVVEYKRVAILQGKYNDVEKDYDLCEPDCSGCNTNHSIGNNNNEDDLCYCGDEYSNSLGIKIVKKMPCHLSDNKIVGILEEEDD